MKHGTHKFTVKFVMDDKIPGKELVTDHLRTVVNGMDHQCCDLKNLVVTYWKSSSLIAIFDLITRDYGVPQVGVYIAAEWIRRLYREAADGYRVDTIVIHPSPNTTGAIVKWDHINDCPIVKMIQS